MRTSEKKFDCDLLSFECKRKNTVYLNIFLIKYFLLNSYSIFLTECYFTFTGHRLSLLMKR